jgi:Flp pilus assembly pilin Flp
MSPPVLRRFRRRGASAVQHAVLAGLIAVGVLGAVVGMGERIRSLFVSSEQMLGDGSAGSPQPPGDDGGSPPAG